MSSLLSSGDFDSGSPSDRVACPPDLSLYQNVEEVVTMGRGILLWLLGIPIPVIILLYLFHIV